MTYKTNWIPCNESKCFPMAMELTFYLEELEHAYRVNICAYRKGDSASHVLLYQKKKTDDTAQMNPTHTQCAPYDTMHTILCKCSFRHGNQNVYA